MCGIAGVFLFNNQTVDKTELSKMTDIITHRGPDGFGHFISESGKVGLGHRRLSILDLSDHGSQPMHFNNLVITYNGEIYNYLELRTELIELGYIFSSNSDTEVILAAYHKWGSDCVQRLNGMWSFIIFNKENNTAFCSRDRYGIKPFYYRYFESKLYIVSEIKQFTVLDGWQANLNIERAFDFLENSLINHTEETLFDSVYELRGGYNLLVNLADGTFKKHQYYCLDKNRNAKLNMPESELINQFSNLLTDAISISLRSDVKVGSALSGGLDSSIIASVSSHLLEQKNGIKNQECVSACFTGDEVDESFYIDELSNFIDIKVNKVYPSFEDFLLNMDRIVWHQDEPFSTLSIYAQSCVFKEAANKGIIVMLDGQGADELLAGYSSFYKPYMLSLVKSKPFKGLKLAYDYLRLHNKYDFHLIWKNISGNKKQVSKFTDSFTSKVKNPFKRPSEQTINDCTFNHLTGYGLHSLLRYEDRNSMSFSVESRVPFLDFRVVNLSLQLGDQLKIKNGIRKFILREAFKKFIPEVIYKRYDKLGFPTPQEKWTLTHINKFRKLLANAELILSGKIISPEIFRTLIDKEQPSKNDISIGWRIILFSRWIEVFKVAI